MPRPQRDLKLGYSDRVTTRCNNREFTLTRQEYSWEASNPEIVDVAEKFIFANCYNPQVAGMIFRGHSQ
ncbi:hypothetical protein IQ276_014205 [Desmonostoc muscorum LEGE 12446]|uniref:Uncharacterized protein n=1 Tax=Desmonostoc muscorum LEGE 12446 TaxID=1828758 RepID=A0A8J7CZR6_DESMC|nr:hypothetical protein [Desmonostoc muscorum]MCF2147550.1 hypothetical protein [Desmonostoc muscorum LEGE 12446]